ncbi:MAG: hypothetical protein IJ906_13275 [Oscillospiraceae bacterium]|nr:hypothetical protein [Oscillospiraceae bacterium]
MSDRAKLLISILFIAAIILTIGLTRFYFDVTKNNGKIGSDDKIENLLQSFGDMQVFRNPSGYCGVIDADGAVVIEPEWMEILDVTPNIVLVSRRIGKDVLIGGIDYEENIVLPFVYSGFRNLGGGYKAGLVSADGSCIIYDSAYRMAFPTGYDAAAYDNGFLILTAEDSSFWYSVDGTKPGLRRAELKTPVGTRTLSWRLSNQVYLASLSEQDLLRMSRCVTAYTDMLLADDFSSLASVTTSDYLSGLSKPGTMPGARIDRVFGFSFSSQDKETYDLAFSAEYRPAGVREGSQMVHMHLLFRRGTDNRMILISANLNFQSVEPPAPSETDEEA